MPAPDKYLLQVKDLRTYLKTAGESVKAVNGVSFNLHKGETFCLVGESGSGKSMLAKSIIQLLPSGIAHHPSGEIIFNWRRQDAESGAQSFQDVDMLGLGEQELCDIRGERIAMIFQEPMTSLNPVTKVGEQITEALMLHNPELSEEAAKTRALKAMDEVQIKNATSRFENYPHEMSGGQRQRIMIAMALACEPDLLIADEPTTALDVTVQAEVLKLMRELQERKNMSILFITHDFGVVAQIADRVGVMKQGELVEIGKTKTVLKTPQHAYSQKLLAAVPENLPKLKKKTTAPKTAPKTLVQIKDLDVHFPIRKGVMQRVVDYVRAVDGVSVDLTQGKIIALVGESGSGKTTLGRALLQLQKPTRGSVKFNGEELVGLSRKDLKPFRHHMQIAFQDPHSSLNPRLLIHKTLTEPMKVHGIGASDEERTELAADVLEASQMKREHLWRYPHEFSGGQKQRIGLARALCLNPEFIVCDEITSALDVSVQAEVLQLLQEIRDARDLTLLFITHNIAVVEYLCDETIVMRGGKIVERGATKDVCGNPQNPYTQKLLAAVPRLKT